MSRFIYVTRLLANRNSSLPQHEMSAARGQAYLPQPSSVRSRCSQFVSGNGSWRTILLFAASTCTVHPACRRVAIARSIVIPFFLSAIRFTNRCVRALHRTPMDPIVPKRCLANAIPVGTMHFLADLEPTSRIRARMLHPCSHWAETTRK